MCLSPPHVSLGTQILLARNIWRCSLAAKLLPMQLTGCNKSSTFTLRFFESKIQFGAIFSYRTLVSYQAGMRDCIAAVRKGFLFSSWNFSFASSSFSRVTARGLWFSLSDFSFGKLLALIFLWVVEWVGLFGVFQPRGHVWRVIENKLSFLVFWGEKYEKSVSIFLKEAEKSASGWNERKRIVVH